MTTPIWPIAPGALPAVVDLSHNNAGFDCLEEFQALKAGGARLVEHKASEGTSFADPMYAKRRVLALDAGLLWDAYHFCTSAPVPAQLSHFLAAAEPDPKTMRLALDAEQNRGATIAPADAAAFAGALDQKCGRQVLRYGNASVPEYRQSIWRDGPLWWAKYGPEPTIELMRVLGLDPEKIVLWQETSTGRVAGSAPIDLSFHRYQAADGLSLWPAIPGFDGMAAQAA